MRSYEDLSAELAALRESDRKWAEDASDLVKENKALKTELDWWRKTFGPEEVAPR